MIMKKNIFLIFSLLGFPIICVSQFYPSGGYQKGGQGSGGNEIIVDTNNHITLISDTITNGMDTCWWATETVTIPEPQGSFVIENGGTMDLVAGTNIKINPYFHAKSGSYFHAYISLAGCPGSPPTVFSVNENGNKEESIQRDGVIILFPNPTTDEINIHFDSDIYYSWIKIEIYNLLGELIFQKTVKALSSLKLDVSFLPDGLYVIQTSFNTGVSVNKIIKN